MKRPPICQVTIIAMFIGEDQGEKEDVEKEEEKKKKTLIRFDQEKREIKWNRCGRQMSCSLICLKVAVSFVAGRRKLKSN